MQSCHVPPLNQASAQEIVNLFPPHVHYLHRSSDLLPLLLKKPARREFLHNNKDVIRFFAALRKHPDQLREACQRRGYMESRFDSSGVSTGGMRLSRAEILDSYQNFFRTDPPFGKRALAEWCYGVLPLAARLKLLQIKTFSDEALATFLLDSDVFIYYGSSIPEIVPHNSAASFMLVADEASKLKNFKGRKTKVSGWTLGLMNC